MNVGNKIRLGENTWEIVEILKDRGSEVFVLYKELTMPNGQTYTQYIAMTKDEIEFEIDLDWK